ncbi:roundabout-like protein 1 [Plakobranchus ocellatus]|uniref:Roundabout-like protein 1 n=1 Tax=Plakobranchus ocellatus TaxID=259542 RepID=A0AAV4CHY1_9GAST|nr:roundabout-like protein 1 [Plakobranchus ocellatus]
MESKTCYFFLRHRRRTKECIGPKSKSKGLLASPATGKTCLCACVVELILGFVLTVMVLPAASQMMTRRPRVRIDPVFLTSNSNITVREGGRAELPCTIQHLGTKKVAWRRVDIDRFLTIGENPWSPGDELVVEHVKHSEELEDWTLVLPKVKKSDAGLYECQLTAVAGFHTVVQLNVVGPPITEPDVILNGTKFVERGGKIELQCNATGGKQVADAIDWFKASS